jgi:uncharacterized protein (TIGR02246 family)
LFPSKEVIMRRAILPLMLLVAVACQPGAGPLTDEDLAAIRGASEQEVVEATLAEDWGRFAAGFTEDAVRMPPNEPLHQGRDAIRQWAEANWGPLTTTEFTMTVEDVDGRDNLAYAWGLYSATVEVPGVPEPVKDIGKFLVTLRKQEDGRWLVSVAMFNSDMPLPGSQESDG